MDGGIAVSTLRSVDRCAARAAAGELKRKAHNSLEDFHRCRRIPSRPLSDLHGRRPASRIADDETDVHRSLTKLPGLRRADFPLDQPAADPWLSFGPLIAD